MHCNAISIPSFVFHCINIIIYVVCGGYLWLWEDLIKGRPLLRFSGILGCSLNFIYAAACDFSRVPVFHKSLGAYMPSLHISVLYV